MLTRLTLSARDAIAALKCKTLVSKVNTEVTVPELISSNKAAKSLSEPVAVKSSLEVLNAADASNSFVLAANFSADAEFKPFNTNEPEPAAINSLATPSTESLISSRKAGAETAAAPAALATLLYT